MRRTWGHAPNRRNLILSPHIAFASTSAREAQENMVLANLEAFYAGRTVPNPIDHS